MRRLPRRFRRSGATEPAHGEVSSRSLPGEGDAPLAEIMQAILENTPDVSIEIEVFSPELAALSPAAAGDRAARAMARWRRTLDEAVQFDR